MTHIAVREWGKVPVGSANGFTRAQANALVAAAKAHRLGGEEGTGIVSDHHTFLKARQMVGLLAAPGCSLEILPKVDPNGSEEWPDDPAAAKAEKASVRARLVHMLDVALGLGISDGATASIARQAHSLLDVLIAHFAERMLAETRRGLPRRYLACEEDLPTLRGRLDVVRQFTLNAVRPDRLSCRYDTLSSDIPLLQVMKACVVFLGKHARNFETRRKLEELRFVLADVADVARTALPWDSIRIDRSNRRWHVLLTLAKMFLKRDWQATHHDRARGDGVTLLFAMNDLFEAYISAVLRRALAPLGFEVIAQGGRRRCIGEWSPEGPCTATHFVTKPDILIRGPGKYGYCAVIDTKWKSLRHPLDEKDGMSQADVYQMMAYSRLYECERLMLLYPANPGSDHIKTVELGFGGGSEMLACARIDLSQTRQTIEERLRSLTQALLRAKIVQNA